MRTTKRRNAAAIVTVCLLAPIVLFSYSPRPSQAAGELTVTLQSGTENITPLGTRYLGTNDTTDFYQHSGNASKYLSDSFYNLSRIFFDYNYVNLGPTKPAAYGANVTDLSSYTAAKDAIKTNRYATYTDASGTHLYIDWEAAANGILNVGGQDAAQMGLGNDITELRKLSIDPLLVLKPRGVIPAVPLLGGNYKDMWEWWKYCYAVAYLTAKNYGVFNFNSLNEPNGGGAYANLTASQLQDIILEQSDAVRDAVTKANPSLTAKIWAPTVIGTGQIGYDVMNNANGKNTDAAIDYYDYHMYKSSSTDIQNMIDEAKSRAALQGDSQPIAVSEFNYHLSYSGTGSNKTDLPVDDLDHMDKVIKSMNALRQMADNDIFAPVNFKLFRDYRNSSFAISGTYPIAMLKADETTSEVSEPIKAYYGYRMINRMLKNPDGNVDKVAGTIAGDTSNITTFATKTNNEVYVLLINSGTTAKTNYIVDYHNLWNSSFKNNNVFVREVSGDGIGTGTNNDEVVGTYTLNGSQQATIPSLPAQSAQLVVLRKNNNTSGGPPIHTLRAQTDRIEIWWNNYANVEDFNVYRSTSPTGGFTKIASHVSDAFYTDSTASAQQNYYYQITSNNIVGEGTPGEAAGPVQIRNEDNTLPWKRDFENGSIAGITQVPGGSWNLSVPADGEDHMIHTSPGAGAVNIAVSGADSSTWKNVSVTSAVKIDSFGTDGKYGLVARYKDTIHYYLFEYDRQTDGSAQLSIKKYDGSGTPSVLATANISSVKWNAGDARHKLMATVSGERLGFYLDTALMLSATDSSSPLLGGKAGLWASNGMDVHFDGVTVAPTFTDDFNSGSADDSWNELSGTWSVPTSGNQAYMYKQSTLAGSSVSLIGPTGASIEYDSRWQDLNLDAKVQLNWAPNSDSEAGLFTRYTDEDNHFAYMLQKSTNQLVLKKVVGGTETVIASATVPALNYGETHTLHVDLQNNWQRVYMDGSLLINQSVYEPALESGRAGLGMNDALASFDQVAVNALIP